MRTLFTSSIALCVLAVACATIAFGQEADKAPKKEEPRDLGKVYTVNLSMEPGDDSQGITMITADGRFSLNSSMQKPNGGAALRFDGSLEPRNGDLVFVQYRLQTSQEAQQFELAGSVIVGIDKQFTIAKSKDKAFKLKIGVMQMN